ncbi:fibronectin type III domain-containing protein [candidate division KSB1 bacterium]|nr:fibronectin type III domain-containing protein [candidate division KSB1 bacterium]
MRGRLRNYTNLSMLGGVLLLISITTNLYGQFQHGYPRTGVFHWGGAPTDWYAKYDMIMTSSSNSNFAKDIKQINPEAIVVATLDINAGQAARSYSDEWTCVDSHGNKIMIYGGSRPLADPTDYCPTVNGKRYNQAAAEGMSQLVDFNYFDGIATDGLWDAPWGDAQNDIDLDRNGVNDNNEHGRDWVVNRWKEGAGKIVTLIDDLIPSDKIFVINGTTMSGYRNRFNGHVFEYGGAFSSAYLWGFGIYMDLVNELQQPHATMIDGCGAWAGIGEDALIKNNFELFRFVLATALMGDAYVGFQIKYKDHYILGYYDEYELDLGQPTSSPQEIFQSGSESVKVRFFQNGVVILNATMDAVNVSDSDIHSLSGYNGPYYRFEGNQDPQWNNGDIFNSSVALESKRVDSDNFVGDALILMREKQAIVTEMIIDNTDEATSPGSQPAELVGGWNQSCGGGNWSSGCWEWIGAYEYASIGSGSGNEYAVYRPTFGVPGKYEVYEWHGEQSSGAASNVPFEITHANGKATGTINQSTNKRKWNLLGTYNFAQGTNNYVKITNAANGPVIADAFKFVYVDGAARDSIPPNSPSNLHGSNVTETSITLTWSAPSPAADEDIAMYYAVYRDDNLVGTATSTTYTDNGLTENTTYYYDVYAVDDARTQSLNAAQTSVTTQADVTPPAVTSVTSLGLTSLGIEFSEIVDKASAEAAGNYSVSNNIQVLSATLENNENVVNLTTTNQQAGMQYSVTVNNVKDQSSRQNACSSVSASFTAQMSPLVISISADNSYELYVNGVLIGSNSSWNVAEVYTVPSNQDKNVIAVKATDQEGVAGVVAEVDWGSYPFTTNDRWKVSTSYQSGWETLDFNDISWQKATPHGFHGSTDPWTTFGDVDGIETGTSVSWIWSADNSGDDEVYLRLTISDMDMNPPETPKGLQVANP